MCTTRDWRTLNGLVRNLCASRGRRFASLARFARGIGELFQLVFSRAQGKPGQPQRYQHQRRCNRSGQFRVLGQQRPQRKQREHAAQRSGQHFTREKKFGYHSSPAKRETHDGDGGMRNR